MAKRKRLIPTQQLPEIKEEGRAPAPAGLSAGLTPAPARAPVAQVAAEAAGAGALQEMSDYLAQARARGLMLMSLPLGEIDLTHLHRDRLLPEDLTADEDMAALIHSLRARGQQTPVDVVRLTPGPDACYGLISGMRRMTALRHLWEETGEDRFAKVIARVVAPGDAPEAYVAMVEENEIRADISFWERARIVVQAVEAGVYPDTRAALRGLFGNVSRAKRSKIGSFVGLVAALDGVLRFPTALSEKRGLALAKALTDPEAAARITAALVATEASTAAQEQETLDKALTASSAPSSSPQTQQNANPAPSVDVTEDGGRLILSGPGVDADLARALRQWLKARK